MNVTNVLGRTLERSEELLLHQQQHASAMSASVRARSHCRAAAPAGAMPACELEARAPLAVQRTRRKQLVGVQRRPRIHGSCTCRLLLSCRGPCCVGASLKAASAPFFAGADAFS
jgi:hypothetical protein